jgi:hypothetical protein
LGLSGFFRVWIYCYSIIAEPLYRLTKKNAVFVWGRDQELAVKELKTALVNAPVLQPLDYERTLIVNVDSGPAGGGGYTNDA